MNHIPSASSILYHPELKEQNAGGELPPLAFGPLRIKYFSKQLQQKLQTLALRLLSKTQKQNTHTAWTKRGKKAPRATGHLAGNSGKVTPLRSVETTGNSETKELLAERNVGKNDLDGRCFEN